MIIAANVERGDTFEGARPLPMRVSGKDPGEPRALLPQQPFKSGVAAQGVPE